MKKYTYLFILVIISMIACRRKGDSSVNPVTGDVLVKSILYDKYYDRNSFRYDSTGNISDFYYYESVTSTDYEDTNAAIHYKYLYTNNRLTGVKLASTFDFAVNLGSLMYFTYNNSDKINKIDYYDLKGKFSGSDTIFYNSSGKLGKIVETTSKSQYYRSYIYNQDDNLSSIIFGNKKGIYDSVWFENYNPSVINPSASLDHLQNYAVLKLLFYRSDTLQDQSKYLSTYDFLPYNLSKNMWSAYGESQAAPIKQSLVTVKDWYYQYPKTILINSNSTSYYFEYISKPK